MTARNGSWYTMQRTRFTVRMWETKKRPSTGTWEKKNKAEKLKQEQEIELERQRQEDEKLKWEQQTELEKQRLTLEAEHSNADMELRKHLEKFNIKMDLDFKLQDLNSQHEKTIPPADKFKVFKNLHQ